MQLMKFPDPLGWDYARTAEDIKAMEARGWFKATEKERQDMIAAKHKKVEPDEPAPPIQEAKAKQKQMI